MTLTFTIGTSPLHTVTDFRSVLTGEEKVLSKSQPITIPAKEKAA